MRYNTDGSLDNINLIHGSAGDEVLSGGDGMDSVVYAGTRSLFTVTKADVQHLTELYVAFFNRVPDADGLAYWIDQMSGGQSINQIAESFYNAGVQYSSLTGLSANMTDQNFINVFYKNVLGQPEGADAGGLSYNTANDSITHGMAIAAAVTATGTADAIALIGILGIS